MADLRHPFSLSELTTAWLDAFLAQQGQPPLLIEAEPAQSHDAEK